MLDCLILGDSIAQGIARQRPECVQVAQVGATSPQFKYAVINQPDVFKPSYHTVVISLGSNDGRLVHSFTYLALIRDRITADRVMWILPQPRFVEARNAVRQIADQFHDVVIEVPATSLAPDKTHPTTAGYHQLAEQTKK